MVSLMALIHLEKDLRVLKNSMVLRRTIIRNKQSNLSIKDPQQTVKQIVLQEVISQAIYLYSIKRVTYNCYSTRKMLAVLQIKA